MITSPTCLRKFEWRGLERYSFLQPVIVLARLSWGRMATSDAALKGRCAWEVERRVRGQLFKQRPNRYQTIDSAAIFVFHTRSILGS